MRKIFVWQVFLFIAVFTLTAKAQIRTDKYMLMQASWEFNKKTALAELMQFDEKEANAFWPVYNKYMKDWSRLITHRIFRIVGYSAFYKNMTPPSMSQFTNDLFVNDVKLTKLQKKTYKKISKFLSPVRANQFMHLEYATQLILLSEMQQRALIIGDVMRKL